MTQLLESVIQLNVIKMRNVFFLILLVCGAKAYGQCEISTETTGDGYFFSQAAVENLETSGSGSNYVSYDIFLAGIHGNKNSAVIFILNVIVFKSRSDTKSTIPRMVRIYFKNGNTIDLEAATVETIPSDELYARHFTYKLPFGGNFEQELSKNEIRSIAFMDTRVAGSFKLFEGIYGPLLKNQMECIKKVANR